MATLKVRFKLNPGRKGIALGKLSKQTENIDLFLRSLASDLGEDGAANLWLASDFKNGSVFTSAELQAVVDVEKQVKFNQSLDTLSRFKNGSTQPPPSFVNPATIERFANLRLSLDADEQLGIGIFPIETGKVTWRYVDRLQLEKIGDSIETQIVYVGSLMGRTHEWNKGADKPYLIVREINTGELVKCSYQDADYSKVANIFAQKTAIVVIEGVMSFNRITSKTEVTMATNFEFAPDFSNEDLEKFFGSAPGITGSLSAAEFIAKGRKDE